MWLSARGWLSAGLLLVAGGAAAATGGKDAQDWLRSMAHAVRTQTYEGVFVYRYRGSLETMRIHHRVHDGAEQERLYALSGSPREVIREGEKVTCILPEVRSVLVDRRRSGNPLSAVVPMDVDALRDTYAFRVLGTGRVAGREATTIGIEPRDEFRYGYRLWIDAASNLLLRADLMDTRNDTVEQLVFTQLNVRESLPEKAFEQTVDGKGFTWYRDEENPQPADGESRWEVTQLPPGFTLEEREWRTGPDSQGPAEHHLYSDGLATVSVYVEPPRDGEGFAGSSSMGAVSAFGRVLEDHQVVVVGEVPAATVRLIGRSIRPRAEQ